MVMIDTLRSDHLPSYGYDRDTAPFLARLAREGIQLQGYSASSWTRPSVATFLTGLHPERHQALSRSDVLPAEAAYLPHLLQDRGFGTAAFVGNMNVGRKWGFDRGFAAFRQSRGARKLDARRVTDWALAMAEELQPPYFLYAHYIDPHDPYQPRRPWGAEQDVPRDQLLQPRRFDQGEPFGEPELERLRAGYDGEIREMDTEIERLFQHLETSGKLDETLVVVTSDHGEEFGEHGGLKHGQTLFEEVLQVPFILWAQPALEPYRSSAPFHQVDFLPTILAALGQPIPADLDGRDRWPEVASGRLEAGDSMLFHLDLDRRGALALTTPSHKLIHRSGKPHDLLFDLRRDPDEQQGWSTLDRRGESLRRERIERHNELTARAFGRATEDLDDELREGLAALGYLQIDTPDEELRERTIPPELHPRRGLRKQP
ncbi:MAG: sulfatase [Acidobacteriota bacterium]